MQIHEVWERDTKYIVFGYPGSLGIHYEKSSPEGEEVGAFLAEHPEALVPEPVAPPPSPEELLRQEMAQLLAYLSSTDWYAIRQSETGEEVPIAVLAERRNARARVSDIRGLL